MKTIKSKILRVLTVSVLAFSLIFSGLNGFVKTTMVKADASALETEFTNGQFSVTQYGMNTLEYVNAANLGTGDGAVLKVNVNGAGSAYITVDFSAGQILAADLASIVVKMYSPGYNASDSFRGSNVTLTAGWLQNEAHDMSTWCDITLNSAMIDVLTDANGYLASATFGVRVHGAATEYYIDSITITEKTPVTFTHIMSAWNDNTTTLNNGIHYTIIHLDGILTSGYFTVGDDWADMLAHSTINGGASYFSFSSASYIAGPDVAGVNWIILFSATAPSEGDEFIVTRGAKFKVGGSDTNVYELTNDICLKYVNGAWEIFDPSYVEPEPEPDPEPIIAPVTFTFVNSTWNNYFYENTYCTFLHFDGGISGNGGLDGDYSDLLSQMTINGSAVDTSNFSLICPNWIGASGGIIFRFKTNPEAGTKMVLPAGASFNIGGTDTNTYVITEDITLIYDGTIWATPVTVNYLVYESTSPEIIHTYKAEQNFDGSFTYVLPEFDVDGKVILGYVMNRFEGETLIQTFIPSGEYTTLYTGVSFIALWGAFTTIDGASIRITSAETSGIRWTTTIDNEGFQNIAYWTAGQYEFGTEISADGFSKNYDIVTKKWKVENATYTGVLLDISSTYYNTEFTARGYVDITYSTGETRRIYANASDTTRSISQVAQLALASGEEFTDSETTILQEIAGV